MLEERISTDEETLIRDFQFRFQKLTGKTCNIIIENKIDQLLRKLSIEDIVNAVDLFRLPTIPGLATASRKRELVNLRKIYCLLAKRAGYSLATIGHGIGERDHTTVIYNIKTAQAHLETEAEFKGLYYEIQNKLLEIYEDRLNNYPQNWTVPKRNIRPVFDETRIGSNIG